MACPYHRQVGQSTNVSGLNSNCDAEEIWRLRVPTPVEETRYCNIEDDISAKWAHAPSQNRRFG